MSLESYLSSSSLSGRLQNQYWVFLSEFWHWLRCVLWYRPNINRLGHSTLQFLITRMLPGGLIFNAKLYTSGFWKKMGFLEFWNKPSLSWELCSVLVELLGDFQRQLHFLCLKSHRHFIERQLEGKEESFHLMGYHDKISINLWQGCDPNWLILGSSHHLLETSFRPLLWLALQTRMKAQSMKSPRSLI